MLAVITIDQRRSRQASHDLTADWVARLNRDHGDQLIRLFTPTVGDEIQGVTATPRSVVEILLGGVRETKWWLGVGIGGVEAPLGETAARSRGPAFYNARAAVEAAKRSHHGFAVQGETPEAGSDIQTVLELLAFLIRRRGQNPARWQALEMAKAGASTVRIGNALGVTQQAASKRLRNAGFEEEIAGRKLAERLLRQAMEET